MANQPKGGYATAIIILAMLGMIIFYMIMVYPSERQKLLRPQPNQTPALFLDKNTYYVGNGKPSINFQYNVSDFVVGYPLKELKVKEDSLDLSANVIKPQIKYYSLNPGEDTVGYKIFLDVKSIDGAIYVIHGKEVVKEITQPGTYEVEVPGSFSIKFSHVGFAFWTVQHAKVSLTIFEEYYDKSNSDVKVNVPVNEVMGEYVGIKFNAKGNGKVKLLLNKNQIFYGEFMNETEIQIPIDESNLKTMNTIEFISDKGSNYKISNFSFYLFSGPAPSLSKTYLIDPVNSTVKIELKVRILKPGTLSIAIMPKGTIFFLNQENVQNGWNYFIVDRKFMNEAHGIKVFSVDGRFQIQEFKIERVS